ncbi:hypothetical protein GUJ93_ZPchr0001g30933 [Zizania palustris]|uniref:Protein kinase domain-containing protein n=1 Tax=Zizania palustris TaxID=103762 RepID=A0A8J5V995_ZIZPA|nr:hypothetical protein GUJ93_ZPchr0001g30933 [Zizania palustris]
MDAAAVKQKELRRIRTLGRGASGAVVWLASDDASGELVAVKSAAGVGGAAEQLRREGRVMSGLCSPHIVPCLGSRAAAGGEYQLLLEFAPGGSLTDEAARNGGRLDEGTIRVYAADVARALAYLHGNSLVHGDVKARNIMVGADGRAKLADFGCARRTDSAQPIGGTPAFMAPEVARGEEQGPAADVWALGCTVIEMATGRAPWSDMDNILAAIHRIGYTDAVPEIPAWLSPEAIHFLSKCFTRNPRDRSTATELLEHPFLASASASAAAIEATAAKQIWTSPKSTLDAEFWESDDDDEEDTSQSAAQRISALASPCSALPDWDSDDGWIDMQNDPSEISATPAPMSVTAADLGLWWEEAVDAETDLQFVDVNGDGHPTRTVEARGFTQYERHLSDVRVGSDDVTPWLVDCQHSDNVQFDYTLRGNTVIKDDFAQILAFLDILYARVDTIGFILQSFAVDVSCCAILLYLAELLDEKQKLAPFVQVLPFCTRLLNQEILRASYMQPNHNFVDPERIQNGSPNPLRLPGHPAVNGQPMDLEKWSGMQKENMGVLQASSRVWNSTPSIYGTPVVKKVVRLDVPVDKHPYVYIYFLMLLMLSLRLSFDVK